jgi:hypothetical protein
MADLPCSTLKDVIETNKYLQLPRLSSQVGFSTFRLKMKQTETLI